MLNVVLSKSLVSSTREKKFKHKNYFLNIIMPQRPSKSIFDFVTPAPLQVAQEILFFV
jgi:hypothetical protein